MSTKIEKSDLDLSTVDVDNSQIHLPFIRTAYDGSNLAASNRSALHFDPKIEPSLTKQSFVEECDINTILNNFAKTGLLSHVNEQTPHLGLDLTVLPEDYQSAMHLVFHAQDAFLALPAKTRDRFDNDPEKFLEFIHNDENRKEAIELGFIPAPPAPESIPDAPNPQPAGGDPQRAQTAGGGASPASP